MLPAFLQEASALQKRRNKGLPRVASPCLQSCLHPQSTLQTIRLVCVGTEGPTDWAAGQCWPICPSEGGVPVHSITRWRGWSWYGGVGAGGWTSLCLSWGSLLCLSQSLFLKPVILLSSSPLLLLNFCLCLPLLLSLCLFLCLSFLPFTVTPHPRDQSCLEARIISKMGSVFPSSSVPESGHTPFGKDSGYLPAPSPYPTRDLSQISKLRPRVDA